MLTHATEFLLGYTVEPEKGKSFSFREKSPFDKGINLAKLSYDETKDVFKQMGRTIAQDHCRANVLALSWLSEDLGHFQRTLLARLKGREQRFRNLVWEVAYSYAAQVRTDYEEWNRELRVTKPHLTCEVPNNVTLAVSNHFIALLETGQGFAFRVAGVVLVAGSALALLSVAVKQSGCVEELDGYGRMP